MKIGREEVRRVAALAALEFEPEAEDAMAASMSRILEYVEQIRGAGDGPEDAPPPDARLLLRDDEPGCTLSAGGVAAAAPSFSNGQFVVPKVLGSE